MPGNDQSTMPGHQAAACVVVIAWGIKAASHILSIIFIALLLSYVIKAGLTGFEGSIIRRVAVSHSVSDLQKSLASLKNTLEHQQSMPA